MSVTLERPLAAANDLFWYANRDPVPINAQLVVGPHEVVVVVHDGAVLGVVPSGTHWLHPQPFPFLAPAVAGAAVRARLCFVRTAVARGVPFGGPLGNVVDPVLGVACSPRVFGDLALAVTDPAQLVRSTQGAADVTPESLVSWARAVLLRKLAAALVEYCRANDSVLDKGLATELIQTAQGPAPELEAAGLRVASVQKLQVSFRPEEQDALMAARTKAAEARTSDAAARACTRCGTAVVGGRFCSSCGAPLG